MDAFTASNGLVVAVTDTHVRVENEEYSSTSYAMEGEVQALREYFLAEENERLERPGPWLGANLGEVWILTFSELTPLGGAYIVGDKHFMAADHGVSLDDRRVIAGRRIWPEVSS